MLTQTIPSYLFVQYADDPDLQAFITAFKMLAQEYVDWFNSISLPVYTGPLLTGDLLDWVAAGLYGIKRPALVGTTLVDDDVFKRVISWHFFKGDGRVFNVRWLKRRIQRFLNGMNGTDPGVNQTYQISVLFEAPNIVNINISQGVAYITGGALFNTNQFNTAQFNEMSLIIIHFSDTTLAPELKSAILGGVVELPFQYLYNVSIAP